jgi:superfamily II DNA helicase RecQ
VARVYLDEDVSVLIATLLRGRNITATTARDEQMLGQSDEAQLERAIALESILVTHNRVHFERLHRHWIEHHLHHYGIILLIRRRDVYLTARKLTQFLAQHDTLENQLWYV